MYIYMYLYLYVFESICIYLNLCTCMPMSIAGEDTWGRNLALYQAPGKKLGSAQRAAYEMIKDGVLDQGTNWMGKIALFKLRKTKALGLDMKSAEMTTGGSPG